MEDKKISEQESLHLITDMIQKVKTSYHEKGTSAILWGTVTGLSGLLSFAEAYFHFSIGFDIWYIVIAAIIPQIFLTIQERRKMTFRTHQQTAIGAIWFIYMLSIGCLIFYLNIIPGASEKLFASDNIELLSKNLETGVVTHFRPYVFGRASLFLILYAIPTLMTGMIAKFKPMLIGSIICYAFFFISCFTPFTWDMLLMGLAGIVNWLIPGIILRNRYLKGESC